MPRSFKLSLMFLLISLTSISLWGQSSANNLFSEAAHERGELLPFQFQVTPGEFRRSHGVMLGHSLTSPSSTELALRNYHGTLADFRSQFPNTELAQAFQSHAESIGIPLDQLRVVMRKNERGFYIPQLVRPRMMSDGSLAPWNPELPSHNMQYISPNFESRIFRADAQGVPQLIGCPESVSIERIRSNQTCLIPAPRARTCGHDPYLADTGKTFQEVAESGINCTKGSNQPTNEYLCMACNLYFESRGEGSLGMEAIAELTLSDQAYQVRQGRSGNTPICDAVYKDNRFSWTLSPAVVDVSRATDWQAWQQSLFIASQTANQSGQANPNIHDPKLHCYRYYVATSTFQNFTELPSWARTYYNQTIEMGDNFRPLCIGNHIFMRDPNERNCPQPDITRTRERDMDSGDFRRMFFRECLGVDEPHEIQVTPPAPNTQLCSQNTIERAIRAHRETGVDHSPPGINDLAPEEIAQ